MDKELIKSEIAKFGYNRYVQNIVCDYFLLEILNVSSERMNIRSKDKWKYKEDSIFYFNLLKCKEGIMNKVIPYLIVNKENFNK